ncbi:hypothetical protein IAT40_003481 [Kwoniella sp. CBS 6097]
MANPQQRYSAVPGFAPTEGYKDFPSASQIGRRSSGYVAKQLHYPSFTYCPCAILLTDHSIYISFLLSSLAQAKMVDLASTKRGGAMFHDEHQQD